MPIVTLTDKQAELLRVLLRSRERMLVELTSGRTKQHERQTSLLALVRATLAALDATGQDP